MLLWYGLFFYTIFAENNKGVTIQRELYGNTDPVPDAPIIPRYSCAAEPSEQVETTIDYYSDTEFSRAIDGRQASEIWPIMDELMSVLQATNTRLYSGVMRKIEN